MPGGSQEAVPRGSNQQVPSLTPLCARLTSSPAPFPALAFCRIGDGDSQGGQLAAKTVRCSEVFGGACFLACFEQRCSPLGERLIGGCPGAGQPRGPPPPPHQRLLFRRRDPRGTNRTDKSHPG